MGHLLQLRHRLAPHPLGGRVGSEEVRVLGLQPPQLVHEGVVLVVTDLRIVQDVVAVVVVFEQPPQLICALARVFARRGRRAHGSTSRAAGSIRRPRS